VDESPALAKDLDELYSSIISDLSKAEELLTINREVGCADKVAAWSILSKTYLTIASAKESSVPLYRDMNFDVTNCYAEAAKWAKKVVDNPEQTEYYLDPDLLNVYDVTKPDGPEHIFLISHNGDGASAEGEYSKNPRLFLPGNGGASYYIKNREGGYDITVDGWSICVPTDKLQNDMRALSPTDKRLTELIKTEFYKKESDGSYTAVPMSPRGQNRYNFSIKNLDPTANGTEQTSCKDFHIRFADIVLVYAEALGRDQGLSWLNLVTQRANGKQYMPGDFSDDAEFRTAVLQERGFELCFEGFRLQDLRRTNNVRKMVDGKSISGRPTIDLSSYTDEQISFFPLPQREVDLNPNL
jgi:hypothetical protein